jgi:hypothetical protein
MASSLMLITDDNEPPADDSAPLPVELELPPAVENRLAQRSEAIFAGGPYQNG